MSYQQPQRALVNNDSQAMTERADVPRSRFIGSWTRNTTFDAGYLVPILVDEMLPGDHVRFDITAYIRMSTPLFPLFDNQKVQSFFFFVPNRLVWANWQKFMGEQKNPSDSINYLIPQLTSGNAGGPYWTNGSIFDHMGLPPFYDASPGTKQLATSALPFRAYNLIFNEWFRDENVQNSLAQIDGDQGDDQSGDYALVRRNKMHDYFTSALPWPQKFTAPNIPLSGQLPVSGIGFAGGQSYNTTSPTVYQPGGISGSFNIFTAVPDYGTMYVRGTAGSQKYPDVYVNLADSAGIALNVLRQSWMIQSLLERDARGGTRYTEIIRSHFGVVSPDMRLQRPEYIGGGSSPLQITPVAQTAPSTDATVGALGAAGTSVGHHAASYAATEHGWVIGLINVQSELSYQQGIPRMLSRRTRYDFYWPALALLGEQSILNQELYAQGTAADTNVFGYQERWHEYRTRTSEIIAQFRSSASGTLDAWHLGQNFGSLPTLGPTFLADTPPMARVLAAGSLAVNQQYLGNLLIKRDITRPMPMHGTPAQLGRF